MFEFVESTALDLLEARTSGGLEREAVRSYSYQLLRALEFCHAQNVSQGRDSGELHPRASPRSFVLGADL